MKTGWLSVQRVLWVMCAIVLLITVLPIARAEPAQQSASIVYYVRYGDTLFSIAMRYGTTVPTIMQANGLTSEFIYAGQRLVIPLQATTPQPTLTPLATPSNFNCTYTVHYRDTVYSIGYRYGVAAHVLMQANYMLTPYLRVGQTLRVPCLSPTPTPFPTHIVQTGQNLFRIAIQYQTSVYAIALTNGIWNPHWVYAGQSLVIPYPGSRIWPPVPTVTPAGTPAPTNTAFPTGPTPTRTATPAGSTPTRTNTPAGPTPTRTATPAGVTPTPPAFTGTPAAVIIMQSLRFVPPAVAIQSGGTVMWQNIDSVNHSVRSGVPGTPTTLFNSGTIAPGGKFYFTFTAPGTYPFYSETDPNMRGTITVQ